LAMVAEAVMVSGDDVTLKAMLANVGNGPANGTRDRLVLL
jgi:hypothetical protein